MEYSMSNIVVCKFGGSSITSHQDVERIRRIISDDPRRKVVVVSAPGKAHDKDTKVTDLLIQLSQGSEVQEAIISRMQEMSSSPVTELSDLLTQRETKTTSGSTEREDLLKSFGEEACARIVAKTLGARYLDPAEILLVGGDFGNAKIHPNSDAWIREKILGDELIVVPGFYGHTTGGKIKTFSRGGSDLTGAYIAAALNATVYENFTDTPGVLAAHPDLVDNPALIPALTFKEMRDLAYSGFGILHQAAMLPVERERIPIHIRKTGAYPEEGTYVVHDRISETNRPIVGVAYKSGFCTFDIRKTGLNDMTGILAEILGVFKKADLAVEHVLTGIDDVSIVLEQSQLKGTHSIGRVSSELYTLICNTGYVDFQDNLGCVVVAGKGLKDDCEVSPTIPRTLKEAGVEVRFMSQGSLKSCIIYGVKERNGQRAVRAIHEKYLTA
jgi:aspartate kinase